MLKQKGFTFFMTQLFNFLEMVKTGRAGNLSDIKILTFEGNWNGKVSICSVVSYSTALDFTWFLILFSIYKVCCSAKSTGLNECPKEVGTQSLRQKENLSLSVLGRTHREMEKKITQQCWAVSSYCAHGGQLPASASTSSWKIFPWIDRTLATKEDVHLQEQDIVVKRRAGKMSEAWKA